MVLMLLQERLLRLPATAAAPLLLPLLLFCHQLQQQQTFARLL
jgi:hypothetical protein